MGEILKAIFSPETIGIGGTAIAMVIVGVWLGFRKIKEAAKKVAGTVVEQKTEKVSTDIVTVQKHLAEVNHFNSQMYQAFNAMKELLDEVQQERGELKKKVEFSENRNQELNVVLQHVGHTLKEMSGRLMHYERENDNLNRVNQAQLARITELERKYHTGQFKDRGGH